MCLLEQQATVLREDLPGFVFESNRGTKHSFTAETTMSPEFAAGWAGHRHKKFRSKMEETRQKVCACSAFLWAKLAGVLDFVTVVADITVLITSTNFHIC